MTKHPITYFFHFPHWSPIGAPMLMAQGSWGVAHDHGLASFFRSIARSIVRESREGHQWGSNGAPMGFRWGSDGAPMWENGKNHLCDFLLFFDVFI